MPRYTVDLHNHTPLVSSDYRGDPSTTARQIVERALEVGIDVWAATDHFSVDFVPALTAAADEVAAEGGRRLLVVPGAEIKVRHHGEETHLVCLLPPARYQLRFEGLLGVLGLPVPAAALDELPRLAVDLDPVMAARIIEAVGGLCHIGHVDRSFGDYRFIDSALVHDLVESECVSAVELIDHSERERFRDGLDVAHISSSDAHSLEEIGRRTTELEMPDLSYEGLRAGLLAQRRGHTALAV